jgi:uroporphyrinogen decarboxylase
LTAGVSCATQYPVAASRMTPRLRIQNLIEGKAADRTPFCPAVYEHKAALIGVKPSELCRDADLFERAIIREVEVYEPDMLVVGCDVYNVEAEAAGSTVSYPDSNDVPAVMEHAVRVGDDVSKLRVPDPQHAGRMPLHLEVGRRIQERFGWERIVRGALSAPFSIASELAGSESLLLAMLDRPDWVTRLLSFTSEIAKAYGKAFVENGLGVILFDSHASPPLTSPALYREMILSPTAEVIRYFRSGLGVPLVPYIMGGDTTILLEDIVATGTNNVLCDHRADLNVFVERLKKEEVLLRANIDPLLLTTQSLEAIRRKARELLGAGRCHPRFLMGTGILPYELAPERVIAVRDAIDARDE